MLIGIQVYWIHSSNFVWVNISKEVQQLLFESKNKVQQVTKKINNNCGVKMCFEGRDKLAKICCQAWVLGGFER